MEYKIKFTVNKKDNVRKAFVNDECIAVFGVAGDLKAADILEYVEKGCESNVVCMIAPNYLVREFESVDKVKAYIRGLYV